MRAKTASARRLTIFAVAGLVPAAAGLLSGTPPADAKTPGVRYCYKGVCHRVLTLAETERRVGLTARLKASFYRSCEVDRYNACGLTSSGEIFDPDKPDNAASPVLPDGTQVLVFNPASGRAVVVRINNTGPYMGDRLLDLSQAAAERLGFTMKGVEEVEIMVLKAPRREETIYRRFRRYVPVSGELGQFASIGEAEAAVARHVETTLTQPAAAIRPALLLVTAAMPEPARAARPALQAEVRSWPRVADLPGRFPMALPVGLTQPAALPVEIDPSAAPSVAPLQTVAAVDAPSTAGEWLAGIGGFARERARIGIRPDAMAANPLSNVPTLLADALGGLGQRFYDWAQSARQAARAGLPPPG